MDVQPMVDRCSWSRTPEQQAHAASLPARWGSVIGCLMSSVLEPGEKPVAYADRGLPEPLIAEYDAFKYELSLGGRQTDAMAYAEGPGGTQTDAFSYESSTTPTQHDALAYAGQGQETRETNVLSYEPAPADSETDAFAPAPKLHREETPVDALLLTDRRLIRAIVEEDKVTLFSAPVDLLRTVKIRVEASYDEASNSVKLGEQPACLSIELPERLRVHKEGPWWAWQLRPGLDPWTEFNLWQAATR